MQKPSTKNLGENETVKTASGIEWRVVSGRHPTYLVQHRCVRYRLTLVKGGVKIRPTTVMLITHKKVI